MGADTLSMKPPSIYNLASCIPFKSFNINLTFYFWRFSALFLRLQSLIASGKTILDEARCRDEMQSAANRMLRMHPDVGAIVLECTNMLPYADTIRCVTGLPTGHLHQYLWSLRDHGPREIDGRYFDTPAGTKKQQLSIPFMEPAHPRNSPINFLLTLPTQIMISIFLSKLELSHCSCSVLRSFAPVLIHQTRKEVITASLAD